VTIAVERVRLEEQAARIGRQLEALSMAEAALLRYAVQDGPPPVSVTGGAAQGAPKALPSGDHSATPRRLILRRPATAAWTAPEHRRTETDASPAPRMPLAGRLQARGRAMRGEELLRRLPSR
jgi:hypothetical protein